MFAYSVKDFLQKRLLVKKLLVLRKQILVQLTKAKNAKGFGSKCFPIISGGATLTSATQRQMAELWLYSKVRLVDSYSFYAHLIIRLFLKELLPCHA